MLLDWEVEVFVFNKCGFLKCVPDYFVHPVCLNAC